MKLYAVQWSALANADVDILHDYIANVVFAPQIADSYCDALRQLGNKLSSRGAMLAPSINEGLIREFGFGVRTVRYKRMTIIYGVTDDTIYIYRVRAASMII
jgi:plasmid stabilization system protein ParE